jgi:competence protein ComEC
MWVDAHNTSSLPALLAAAGAAVPDAFAADLEAEVTGTIISAVEIDGDRVQFRVTASSVRVKGEQTPLALSERLLVQVRLAAQPELALAAKWRRGDRIRLAGEFAKPAEATNFGGFDYHRYLKSQRIHWLFKASGAAAVHTSAGPRWSTASLLSRIDTMRAALGSRMDALYPGEQSGYMKGLVLGISEDLDPERFRQFAQLGLTHILAISGLHVAVFLYVLGGLLRLLRMTRERMLLLMIAAVPFYVLLAGGSPSVIRAGIMAMLGLAAARMHKLKDGLHLLSAAALLMLAWDPYMLSNVGFQLSFLVTAGLILGVPPVRAWMPNGSRTKALFDLIAVTMVAQAVSFPLTRYYFNQFHLLSLMANFVLVPFISFIVMPLGGASLILDTIWHPAGSLVAMATELANHLTFGFVQKLSRLQSFRMIWATPPLQWVLYMYAALALCLGMLKRAQANREASFEVHQHSRTSLQAYEDMPTQPLNAISDQPPDPSYLLGNDPRHTSIGRKWIPFFALFALVLPLVWAYYPDWNDHDAYVSFIDVGQGDSILVRTASGEHILIDGGGTVVFRKPGDEWRERSDPFEVGQKVVVPLLQQRGVHNIDLLVLSHLDSDHIKGLIAVLGQIPVKRILWNGTFKPSADAISVLQTGIDQHIPLYTAAAGLSWRMDDHTVIEVIGNASGITAGRATAIPTVKEQNGQSVALLLHLYERSFLLTGDADEAEEQTLLSQYQSQNHPQKQAIDVLKVSHHGSKTSSSAEWLSYWQPNLAVISVGRNNLYGHPNRNVLQRIEAIGAGVKRTDLNGEVQFRITPSNQLEIRQKLPNHNEE